MKQLAIALVLILAASVIAHLHAKSQTYYPVVKITAPDGVTYTALQGATTERPACAAANRRFLDPMRARCGECEVTFARCERELEGFELALSLALPAEQPVVSAPGFRLAIDAEEAKARVICEWIAGDMVKRGAGAASCQ